MAPRARGSPLHLADSASRRARSAVWSPVSAGLSGGRIGTEQAPTRAGYDSHDYQENNNRDQQRDTSCQSTGLPS